MTDDERPRPFDVRREALYRRMLAERGLSDEFPTADRTRPLPASFAQERAWFLDQLEAELPIQNVTKAFWLRGTLDVSALERALSHVTLRHEPLRTTFELVDGTLVQRVQPPGPVGLERRTLAADAVSDLVLAEARQPVDLERGPILRAVLAAVGEVHALVVTVHHIAADGWSAGLLVGEICAAYTAYAEGRAPDASLPAVQYVDVAAWQRSPAALARIEDGVAHFRRRLANPPPTLELPASHPPPSPRTGRGGEVPVRLGDLEESLQTLCDAQQTTVFEVLLAGYAALLSRITGVADLVIGTPYANRPHHTLESLIGLFATTIPIRVEIDGRASFRELLRRVRGEVRSAATFQSVPFDRIVQAVRRSHSDTPQAALFNVWFALQNWPMPRLALPALQVEPIAAPAQAIEFDLSLDLWRPAEGLGGRLEFARDLLDERAASSIVAWYRTLLADALTRPDVPVASLRLLDAHARVEVLALGRGPDAHPHDVLERIRRHALEDPTRPAVIDGTRTLDFAELDRRTDHLAAELVRAGMGPERLAAIRLPPDWRFAVAVIGVLKTGGAFLPIEPDTPAPRLDRILADARPTVIISARGDDELELAGGAMPTSQAGRSSRERLAYVIYTSGSTGQPKGALTSHRCLDAYVAGAIDTFGLTAADRILQFAPVGFDVIIEELFPVWSAGGSVVFRGGSLPLEPRDFVDLIDRHGITVVEIPNLYWHLLADEVERGLRLPRGLRILLVGCGAMATDRVRAWRQTGVDLVHVYGLSETTITSTVCDLARWDVDAHRWSRLPIGYPTAESRVYVLDDNLEPVPQAVRGAIYLGGDLVGRGYQHAPGATADRFVPDPFDGRAGARMYRTGDGGRFLADGTLDFLGRKDEQVKIRGFRVELGEVDAGCRTHADVLDVATIAVPSDGGDHRLVSFVVARTGVQLDERRIRVHLRERLPAYMVPSEIAFISRLPETTHGKVDRKALAGLRRAPGPRSFVTPRTATEATIATVWREMLAVNSVGADDDFFMLGGHSLLATRVAARLRVELEVAIPVKWLFEAPVLRDLAGRIDGAGGGDDARIPRRAPGIDAPLSFMQEHLWFLHQLDPASAAYHLPTGVRLRGALDIEALRSALTALALRHEILRTVFIDRDAVARQRVLDRPRIDLEIIDLSTHDAPLLALEDQARRAIRAPFELESAPPIRAHLWRLGEQDHVLLLTLHHLLADAWSLGIILEELTRAYESAATSTLSSEPAPRLQFADVAVWQHGRMTPERMEQELAYWKRQLAGRPHGTVLRGDHPRPSVRSGAGETLGFEIADTTAAGLRALARATSATPASVLLAAFAYLLHRRTGDSDIVVGVPSSGREHPDTHRLIGCLLNTVVTRLPVGSSSFIELAHAARNALTSALAHSEVPFQRVVEAMGPPRDLSLHPLFQVMFSFEQQSPPSGAARALRVDRYGVHTGGAQFDLTLDITDDGHVMNGVFCFATDLFTASTAAALRDELGTILETIAADPTAALPPPPARTARVIDVRGFHIDLDEVDAGLRSLPAIRDCHSWVAGDPAVLSAVIETSGPVDEAVLRHHLDESLAAYMVPGRLQLVTQPFRDEEGRPLPDVMRSHAVHPTVAVRRADTTSTALAELWREVLGIEAVHPDDNFFAVGGDSLTCLSLVAKARSRGIAFTPRDVFRHQTLAELTMAAAAATPSPSTATTRFSAARVSRRELTKLLDHVERIRR